MRRVYDTRRLRASVVADAVAATVQGGGTVIFPTDTVYGIGCDPVRADAVERIFALKGRPRTKPLALHFASVAELLEYAPGNDLAAALARGFLPGPLTLIVARPRYVDAGVTGGLGSLGLRVPKHEVCRVLLERCGPLAATSANLSGSAAYTGGPYVAELPAADVRVDDGPTPLRIESTIVDVTTGRARVVREGAIGIETLEALLGDALRPAAKKRENQEER